VEARIYGVPTNNFFGWFLTVYIFYQLFALYLRNRVTIRSRTSHWRLAILFYAASAAGNLLVVAPSSLGGVFVDAAGKHWAIPDILWASRLVSIFTHDAYQPDCLGQSLRTSRTLLETGTSGYSERVTGNPSVSGKVRICPESADLKASCFARDHYN
jgi:hypothetical protein